MKFSNGPSVILNSGSIDICNIHKVDKYGRHGISYVVGEHNRSFQELRRIINELIIANDLGEIKTPWSQKNKMIHLYMSNKKNVPIVDGDTVKPGDFCKVNVTPSAYIMQERSVFRLPDGSTGENFTTKKGIKLFLNGIKVLEPVSEEDLF